MMDAALQTAQRVAKSPKVHVGAIHSSVAGRTDHLPMNVKSGSYVLPADVVSAMGEGNTAAGFKVAKSLPSMWHAENRTQGSPYDSDGLPYGGPMPKADGGPVDGGDVPIVAAGGEHVYSPEEVTMFGGGDLGAGHKTLDEFVKQIRANNVKTLQKLPGPRKD